MSAAVNGQHHGVPESAAEGNIADLVGAAARREPRHPALVEALSGHELSWSELDAAVSREAHRLRSAGAVSGDRIAVHLPTGTAFCIAFFGALRAECVAVPVSKLSPPAEVGRIVTDSGATVLVTEEDSITESGLTVLPPAAHGDDSLVDPVVPTMGGRDLAVLFFTSGTSGPPRAAMLSHGALIANVQQCSRLRPMPVNAADRVLLALPLFHAYGLGPGLLQVASVGATAVLLPRFDAEEALDVIARERVTTVVGVPPMYSAWLTLPTERLREAMATVRLLTSGAAPLGPDTAAAMRSATGLDVFEGYGLTETGPVLTSTLGGGHAKPGSVGRPLPGVELRLVDIDGSPLGEEDEDDTGRVAARGPNLFSGYWPDGSHGPDEEGWFVTGDVGYLDADGDLHLVDRASDLIIVNGFNVYPHEVETTLLQLDGVVEAAVVGIPDQTSGEAVKALIVPEEGARLSEEDVRKHCAEQLAKFKVPTVIEFVGSLPYSPTGKVARRMLRG